jgi:hypothetical protein
MKGGAFGGAKLLKYVILTSFRKSFRSTETSYTATQATR